MNYEKHLVLKNKPVDLFGPDPFENNKYPFYNIKRNRKEVTETDRNGQKFTTNKKGQTDRNKQQGRETNRNGQKWTEEDTRRQKRAKFSQV